MNPNRIPKHCCNGSSTKNCKVQQTADKFRTDDTLKLLERKIDTGAAHIGLVIADIFTFLTKSAAMLPNMELQTELLNLTVDDRGISVYIKRPCNSGNGNDDPEEFELVQAEITRRKTIGRVYSSSNIFSTKLICSCCGGYFGSKVWHSTSKYRRIIWQCNHKFSNGEKCNTPHLYEDAVKEKFIEVCGIINSDKADFLMSCQQIRDILSDCTALDEKIHEQYVYLNELAAAMQNFIKENAMHPQSDDFYNKELASYEKKKADGEAKLNDLQSKKASRLSRKELLDGLIRTLEKTDMTLPTFNEKLWRFMVESVTVGADGKLTFALRNSMEIEV